MNRTSPSILALVAATVIAGAASSASAQSGLQQVLDLNRQGMDAYMNLELERAQQLLEQALQAAQSGNVTGSALARTYANLGVVAVGGFSDNGRGLNYFVQALQEDPALELDPLTSTPEIQTVFALARQRAGTGGGQATGGGAQTSGGGGAAPSGATGNIPHQPVPEQLAQTAVPVYVEVSGDPEHVFLYYRGHGMREYQRVEMQSVGRGFGHEIPCEDVYQPSVQYYIVAFATDGTPMGYAGTEAEPVAVNIVGSRSQPAPALPGRAPPEQCSDAECPPGMEGCDRGGAGMGASCSSNGDCSSGLVCEDEICVAGESGGGGEDGGMPRFFLHVGGTIGLGYAEAGMQADTCPPGVPCEGTPGQAEAYVEGGTAGCGLEEGQYCVRVGQAGLVPTGAIRVAVGGYFLPWLGVAGFARFQPASGFGDLSFAVLGLRLQAQLTEPAETGIHAHVFAGFSVGQVQLQPPSNGENAPYIISGLNGVPIGAIVGYRFMKHFGMFAQLDLMFQFPTFMYNTDITVGLETGF